MSKSSVRTPLVSYSMGIASAGDGR